MPSGLLLDCYVIVGQHARCACVENAERAPQDDPQDAPPSIVTLNTVS